MKTGILGGTFNPPHMGHLHAAQQAYEALRLDRVLFIPTGIPPHKALPHNTANAVQRCDMVRLLIAQKPWAELCTMEIMREGKSFTVDTLRALMKQEKQELFLIIGTDMLLSFDTKWKSPKEISRLATLVVCAREQGKDALIFQKRTQLQKKFHTKVELIHGPVFPASSTQIRNGENLSTFTAPDVAQYIKDHKLYNL